MTEKLTNAINEILNKLDESLSVDDILKYFNNSQK